MLIGLFDILWTEIFPFLGDLFGRYTALLQIDFETFMAWANPESGYGGLRFTNLFTGVRDTVGWVAPNFFVFVNTLIAIFEPIIVQIIPNIYAMPVWQGILYFSIFVVFVSWIISGFWKLIKG